MWRLADPLYLLLLILPIGLYLLHRWSHKRGRASVLFSGGHFLHQLPQSWRAMISPHLHWLRYFGLALLAIAMARPQGGHLEQDIKTYGVDMMLILDVSGTMAERDMVSADGVQISRLVAAKSVMDRFIERRTDDRLGLVAFATQSLTRCPLTVDHDLVRQALADINMDLFADDMRLTAIGNALATGVARLQRSDARSKAIILLTDGSNNSGNITPTTAANIAKTEGIKVYTIGFGHPSKTDVDEQNLQELAQLTGGKFFRSQSLSQLQEVYDQIDKLEKSEIVVKNYEIWDEWFPWFLWAGTLCLLLEVIMNQIICRKVP